MSSECDLAWAAGLYEGEGSITVRSTDERQAVMTLAMTNREPVERFVRIVQPEGKINGPYIPENAKHLPLWRWQTARWAEITRIGNLLTPWLSQRRIEQLHRVLAFCPAELANKEPRIEGRLCETEVRASKSGYMRHWRLGERPCDTCRESYALWTRLNRKPRDKEAVRASNRAQYLKNRDARLAYQRTYNARKRAGRHEGAISENTN